MIASSAIQLLVPLYNSNGRYYHDMKHIYCCLFELDEFMDNAEDKVLYDSLVLEYAIWFHDAIYSPYQYHGKNEIDSAVLFNSYFSNNVDEVWRIAGKRIDTHGDMKDREQFYKDVWECIVRTGTHLSDNSEMNDNVKLMLDIDLASLAKSWEVFSNNNDNILKEYMNIGYSRYQLHQKSIKFLQSLLSKKRIYYTDYFHDKYESNARSNIRKYSQIYLTA